MNTFTHVDMFDGIKSEHDLVISEPDFLEEIKYCERFRGSFSSTTVNYLRSIASEFGKKYDKAFNPYRNIVPSDFQGIPFKTSEDVSKIVRQMFLASYPQIFKSYLESQIRDRSFNCEHVIVVGFSSNLVDSVMSSFDFQREEFKVTNESTDTDESILNEMLHVNDTELKPKKVNKNKRINSDIK
jgi:hypothetical protein